MRMNIIVCVKQVPGSNKVEVDPVTGVLKRDGVESKMNPYDLFALETALRLKETYGGTVKVISMGPPQAMQIIREAFAMGADEGILLSDRKFAGADVLATSYTLSQGVMEAGEFDLILCGKQTTDGDTAQVGPEMAEYLNVPSVSNIKRIVSVDEEAITIEMDMSHTVEIAKVKFPCLLAVEKDILMPRLPSYIKMRATKDREIKVIGFSDLKDQDEKKYGLNGSPTQVQRIFPPESNSKRELWNDSEEVLADKLFQKLKEEKFI